MHAITITVGALIENCYVLWEDPKQALVIDPGAESERIVARLDEEGVRPALVVNTHGHFDHTGAVGALVERYGVPYKVHRDEVQILDMTPPGTRLWGLEVAAVPEPTGHLQDGETISLGALRVQVLHTPGHTPGSLCFWVPARDEVYTGDTLFQRSIGRSDFPGGDHDKLLASIRGRLFTLAPNTRVRPGHGPDTTVAQEKRLNPFVGDAAPVS